MGRKIVLVIEDNPDDELLLRRAFSKANITDELVVAVDGELALAHIGEAEETPSLIVLDLHLPKMSGLDVLRNIRTKPGYAHIPVVMVSADASDAEVAACMAAGANSFVKKPVEHALFQDAVLGIGLYWLLLNQTPELVS